MSFQGVVHNHFSDLDISIFTLDNSFDTIKIPRSQKELFFENDDTIIKVKGLNKYIVKRRSPQYGQSQVDTSQFYCY